MKYFVDTIIRYFAVVVVVLWSVCHTRGVSSSMEAIESQSHTNTTTTINTSTTTKTTTTIETCSSSSSSLSRVRKLQAPTVTSQVGGEIEHLEFWQDHEDLLKDAWNEWADNKNHNHNNASTISLPELDEETIINPNLYDAIHDLWRQPTLLKEASFQQRFWKTKKIPGVYVCSDFLTKVGIQRLRYHFKEASQSGIPTRRPNGMNRYGLVLDDETEGGVSYPQLNSFLDWLVGTYVRPLGRLFFPSYIGSFHDDESSYAFTIHYQAAAPVVGTTGYEPQKDVQPQQIQQIQQQPRDVELKEHSDASVVTININLNLPEDGDDKDNNNDNYQGSALVFVDEEDGTRRRELKMEPGMAVLHRGLHRHQAMPIQTGQRHQLIVWLFGRDGYVRFAPYEKKDRMTLQQRWSRRTRTSTKDSSDNCNYDDDDNNNNDDDYDAIDGWNTILYE